MFIEREVINACYKHFLFTKFMFRLYLFTSLRTTLYFQQPTKAKGYICKLLVALRTKNVLI